MKKSHTKRTDTAFESAEVANNSVSNSQHVEKNGYSGESDNSVDFDTFAESKTATREKATLEFWKENHIFEKSLEKPSPKGEFVFYEGPPTANGRPGIHHLEARAFKDAIPRYKTMRGYHVRRRGGWDTHGLPVELEVEKSLQFSGKKDIEAYGIGAFNKKCRESVWKYIDEWRKFTERMGYWVDQGKAYFTYDATYIESLWSILKHISKSGRLYKDYKVVPWCARCGTALSSHELAQGYEDVKDLSVTVEFLVSGKHNTYFLAWTTTPWTLPGNVALAVNPKMKYVTVEKETEGKTKRFILAKDRLEAVFGDETYRITEETLGSELVGMSYEALYPFARALASAEEETKFQKAHKVYPAQFVTAEDGTGIVHTAIMYGQDDFVLGTEVGLPKVHVVGADGRFIAGTGFLEGRFVKDEEVAVDIIKDLAGKGILFSKNKYEHSYPFCWRCKTPLIYYARDSWYIRMNDLRETMLAENEHIHWEPEHIKKGRFGEWLAGAKDWAISRERYWGTPLPVWENADGSESVVIGSLSDLAERTKTGHNVYVAVRHGESQSNIEQITSTSANIASSDHLTESGRAQVLETAKGLKENGGVDIIFTSPFARTRETAKILAKELGVSETHVLLEDRLREIDTGIFDGKKLKGYESFFERFEDRFDNAPEGGETLNDVKHRTGALLYELESRYSGKRILLVSHGRTIWALRSVAQGLSEKKAMEIPEVNNAEVVPLDFVPLPHNEKYELDLHRPYIDDVVLESENGEELHRVKEVMDVWFDSGAMPFASEHYPFENREWVEGHGYPADFISEAIDQTRGWFYTLHAVGTLTGRGHAYKNVICLGHLLDDKGRKMSKSKGNVINPWEAMAKWGVDTLRFWMYSVNQPGESKSFDGKTIREVARTLSWFENSAKFYSLFKNVQKKDSTNMQIIDRWMLARTKETVRTVTQSFDEYKLFEASRTIAKLLEDLSQWYVRRIRDRAREGDSSALNTLRDTLRTISLLIAPLAPFMAEEVFQNVRTDADPESVHLASWPEEKLSFALRLVNSFVSGHDKETLAEMERVRTFASEALMLRQKEGIKVRQPLSALSVPGNISREFATILADEVNVKKVNTKAEKLSLDTKITDDLVREGDVREFTRALAEARKSAGLSPTDTVRISIEENGRALLEKETIAGVSLITFDAGSDAQHTAKLSFGEIHFSITNDAT